ncbi:MAG: hypothetical protein QM775_08115 [Pirellulales bacterium]
MNAPMYNSSPIRTGADDERHAVRGRRFTQWRQSLIVLGERQVVGQVEFVACERKLRKHEQPHLRFRRGAHQPQMFGRVRRDGAADRHALRRAPSS